jgi:hypothetical protein
LTGSRVRQQALDGRLFGSPAHEHPPMLRGGPRSE